MYVVKFMNDGCSLEVNKVEDSNELYFEVFYDNDDFIEKRSFILPEEDVNKFIEGIKTLTNG